MTRQRSRRGNGTIQKLGRNHYRVLVDFGIGADGKRQRPSKTVHGTRRDAEKAISELQSMRDSGIRANGGKMTFSELAGEWLAEREALNLAEATLQRNRYEVKVLDLYFGPLKLEAIDAATASKRLRQIQADRGVGNTTMHSYRACLKTILEWAVDYDLIPKNPISKLKIYTEVDEPNRDGLSPFDAMRLKREIQSSWTCELEKYHAKEERQDGRGNCEGREYIRGLSPLSLLVGIRLALETGMRLEEVFGLTWARVDFKNGLVIVREAVGRDGNLKKLKTRSSRREIRVNDGMIDLLLEWKSIQSGMLAEIGIEQKATSPVCCREVGGFIGSADAGRRWRRWRDAHGFKGLKFHELRHTQATILISRGVSDITVMHRLGHKNVRMTQHYAHPTEEADYIAAQVIGDVLGEARREASETASDARPRAI